MTLLTLGALPCLERARRAFYLPADVQGALCLVIFVRWSLYALLVRPLQARSPRRPRPHGEANPLRRRSARTTNAERDEESEGKRGEAEAR